MKKHINKFGIIALVVMIAFFAAGCESPLTLLDREGDNPGTGPDKPTTGSDFTQVDKSNFDSNKPPAVPDAPTGLNANVESTYIDVSWNAVSVPNASISYYVSISGPTYLSSSTSSTWDQLNYYGGNLPNGTYTVDVYAIAQNDNGVEWSLLPSSTTVTVDYYDFSGTSWELITYDTESTPGEYTLTITFLPNGTFTISGSIWDDTAVPPEEVPFTMDGSYTAMNGGYAELIASDGSTRSTTNVAGYPSNEYFGFLGVMFYKVYP